MGATKGALTFLLLAVTLLATRQLALGQSEVATLEGSITVDKEAHGTKVSGTLTVDYGSVATDSCAIGVAANFFFMRVKEDKDLFAFSGDLSGKEICLDDTFGQQAAIETFVKDRVIPVLFPATPSAPFALKAVYRFVQGVRVPLFVMTDFVIMVQEK